MNCYELVERAGGEIVCGRARVRQGSKYVLVGQLNGDSLEMTEAGRLMAAELEATEKPVPKRTRKPKVEKPVAAPKSAEGGEFGIPADPLKGLAA